MSTVGLALIAKDEERTLPTLLASIRGCFDEAVLVDTGSTDRTVEIFEQWARQQGPAFRWRVEHFAWRDDFSAARRFADALLTSDWLCWADCDDELRGAHNLRPLAASAPDHVVAYIADYDYAQDPQGNCICRLRRERLVRRGAGTWAGRVHEAQELAGDVLLIDPQTCEWVHRKPPGDPGDRNLRILRSWLEDEPENPRVLAYLGTEHLARNLVDDALGYFRRYLNLKTGWDEERAQVHRKAALCHIAQGDHEAAIRLAWDSLRLLPAWPDSHLTLAEAHYHLGEFGKAEHWAGETLARGVPETLLIINPLDYTHTPLVIRAAAVGAQGRVEEAIEAADLAAEVAPLSPELVRHYEQWRAARKREHTANTWVGAAELLISHDEQEKALRLLEAAPHYATDHPRVVALRSMLRERLMLISDPAALRAPAGQPQPEGGVPDGRIRAVGDALPRCRMLLAGVREQLEAAA